MKKTVVVVFAAVMLFSMSACGNKEQAERTDGGGQTGAGVTDSVREPVADKPEPTPNPETENPENTGDGAETENPEEIAGSNILVAYFSRVGNMNFDESIDAVTSASVNMNGSDVAGNAQLLAEMAQEITGGDLFFIETAGKYPAEYRRTTDQAKEEQNNDARPELSSHVENMDAYDTILLIYPNWWGTLPQSVFTFLEEYDFSGKTILPLCTHEGSRLGRSEKDIAALCPDAQLLKGLSVKGADAGRARAEVEEWINGSGILE